MSFPCSVYSSNARPAAMQKLFIPLIFIKIVSKIKTKEGGGRGLISLKVRFKGWEIRKVVFVP